MSVLNTIDKVQVILLYRNPKKFEDLKVIKLKLDVIYHAELALSGSLNHM